MGACRVLLTHLLFLAFQTEDTNLVLNEIIPPGTFDDSPTQLDIPTSKAIVLHCFKFPSVVFATNCKRKALCKLLKLKVYSRLSQAKLFVVIASVLNASGIVGFDRKEGQDLGREDVKVCYIWVSFAVCAALMPCH